LKGRLITLSKHLDVAKQVWGDFLNCAKLFTSFSGLMAAGIALVNAFRPDTLSDLSFTKPKSKSKPASTS